MAVDASISTERRPLLGSPVSTERPDYGTQDHEVASISSSQTCVEDSEDGPPLLNKFSKGDACWILAGLWSAVFLGALDGTVVATLLTPIGSYFSKSNQASYIGTSYLLSVCCFTPLYGRLSDILGRKGAMLLALTLFGSGTIFCGLAPSMELLIAARAVAGMGGGGVMTVSSIVVTDFIPLKQRGLYQGMANILFGLGAGIGGPLGGWINDNFGWQSAFFFQAPVLLFSFVLVTWKVNIQLPVEVQSLPLREKLKRIDFLGSITLVGTVGCLLLGFSLKTTEELPWSHPHIYGLFTASTVFGVLFLLVETKLAPYPVMPLRLMTQRTPLAVSMSNLFGSMAAFSTYFSAVYLYSSADSGLHLLPHSIAISTGSVFAGWIMRRTGKLYTLTLCSAMLTILASVLIVFWNKNTGALHLWLDIVPQGFGMASLITSTLIAMIAGVTREDMAVATGITYLFRTTGQVLGVSISGATLQAVLLQKLRERIQGPGSTELIYEIQHSTNIIPSLSPRLRQAAIDSYADALRIVFICQAAWNFLAFLWCLPIQENILP
ncbi:vacuolar amino acid permease [Moniliophthora roreri MCA 2997]|uniref:Vacuolar amino acid permease n=1 Tax=Moniliophthora roreri (strain MCA 2997) TaxID=1381753 RepID=V2XXJ2_MONRO|nr:vacuolar amino acid permease [Moniliophthora roreri MCA 2997]